MATRGGSGSRMRTKERRAKEKRARKDTERAKYQAWAASGDNTKKRRGASAAGHGRRLRRPNPGNTGCLISHPELVLPALVRNMLNERAGHRGQFSSRYGRQIRAFIDHHDLSYMTPQQAFAWVESALTVWQFREEARQFLAAA